MALVQFEGASDIEIVTVWYTGTTTLHEGALLFYATNADPDNAAFGSGTDLKVPGVAVTIAAATVEHALFAGVLTAGSAGATDPGFIDIYRPRIGDVVTVAVAAAIDAGDGGVLANSQQHLDDGAAWDATTDSFFVLYDEDNANNPHGTDAISGTVGLVEAIYLGHIAAA